VHHLRRQLLKHIILIVCVRLKADRELAADLQHDFRQVHLLLHGLQLRPVRRDRRSFCDVKHIFSS
jgi:hypothetical protein